MNPSFGARLPRPLLTAWLGLSVAIAAPLVVLAVPSRAAGLVAVLVFACAAGGSGVMCWIDAGDGAAQAGLVLVTSLAAFALAATALIWLHAWSPSLLWLLGAASAASCLARLVSSAPTGRRA
jgi:hypothetical protein